MENEADIARYPEKPLLILDDDETLRTWVELLFVRAGLNNILSTADPALGSSLVKEGKVGLVLLDLFLPSASGEDLLRDFSRSAPEVPVIVLTAVSDPQTIVRCMRAGASDYIVKPIDETRLFVSVWNALATLELQNQARDFRDRILGGSLEKPQVFAAIVTCDERMILLFKYIESVARSRQPVLIRGETGTGKELFARAIHEASGRAGPFVAVNVGGLDDSMFSDCLFGHRKGAYTGADSQRAGMIKEAAGGTILLDEVGDLEAHSQIKLLRLLQEGEYFPLGADSPLRSDARVVAATTKDLKAATAEGSFRSDLFYRLQTHPILIPPLRERPADLGLLVRHFLEKSFAAFALPYPGEEAIAEYAKTALREIGGYPFPGNVRELQSLVHDLVAGSRDGSLDMGALRARMGGNVAESGEGQGPFEASQNATAPVGLSPLAATLAAGRIPTIEEAESELVRMAISAASGRLSQAAAMLGISRQTLYNKLKTPRKPT